MATQKKDPVDKGEIVETGLLDALNPDSIRPITARNIKVSHPFDGYKNGPEVKVGEAKASTTFIVLLEIETQPDPSNEGVTISKKKKNDKGKVVDVVDEIVTLGTYHNRHVQSPVSPKKCEDVIFDRVVIVGDKKRLCAIVRDPATRARIVLKMVGDPARIMPDSRYRLADYKQADLLAKLFKRLHKADNKHEARARRFDSDKEA